MNQDDPLQNAPESEITSILECIKPDFPLSISVYYFIDCLVKWKKKVPTADIGILTPKGGYKSGAVFVYLMLSNDFVCSAYAWTKEGSEALRKSILGTKRLQWEKYKIILFSCLNDEVWSIIKPLIPELLKDRPTPIISHDKVFWLPADEVVKFDIKVPEGMYLGELKEEHAELIDSVWPHRYDGSLDLIKMVMRVNFGRGLFKSDGQLVAWAFYWFFGTLGVVQTVENEKRKGYGKVVVQALCKEMGNQGLDVNLNIIEGNVVSEQFFKSLEFRHAFDCVWVISILNSK